VRRRLELMSENTIFFLSPIVDVKRVEGFLYHFVISYSNKKDKLAADEKLHGSIKRIVFADTTAEYFTVLSAICQNISDARQITDWLRSLKGVKEVTASIFEDIIFVHEWLENEIEKQLRE
jgi:hypothetical protein